jgi:hypothetical protein
MWYLNKSIDIYSSPHKKMQKGENVQLNGLNDWMDVLRERKDLMDVVPC